MKVGAVPLACASVQGSNAANAFTGGASDGDIGVATQLFTAPLNAGLSLQRHVSFFNDSIAVVLGNITSFTTSAAGADLPVATTIESVRLDVQGGVWFSPAGSTGAPQQLPAGAHTWAPASAGAPQWLWHNGSGYILWSFAAAGASPASLAVNVNPAASGNWGRIGAEAAYGNASIPLLTISLELAAGEAKGVPAQYSVIPGVTLQDFAAGVAGDAYGRPQTGQGWLAAAQGGKTSALTLSVFTGGAVVPAVAGDIPAVSVTSPGSYVVTMASGAGSLSVSAANPLQQAWKTSLSFAGLKFTPSSGNGYTCAADGTMSFTAPPPDGSSATATCSVA